MDHPNQLVWHEGEPDINSEGRLSTETFDRVVVKVNQLAKGEGERHRNTRTVRIARSAVSLEGKIGRWWGYADDPVWNGELSAHRGFQGKPRGVCPPEILAKIDETMAHLALLKRQHAAMSPEAQEAAVQQNLEPLSRSPGFFQVRFPLRRKH